MSGCCERIYVRFTPGEKARALNLASRNGLTVSQLVRVLIQLPANCASEGVCTAVVLERVTMRAVVPRNSAVLALFS